MQLHWDFKDGNGTCLFYDFITNGDPDKESATNIDAKIGHYNAMEITSLLVLAIWKQSILRGFFDEMQEVHDYAAFAGQYNKPQHTFKRL